MKALRRDHTAIAREIRRNTSDHLPYSAKRAQALADKRERERTRRTLEKDKVLCAYVVAPLKNDLSPEQIAGVLHNDPPTGLEDTTLNHETLDDDIDNGKGRYECLYPHREEHGCDDASNAHGNRENKRFLSVFRCTNAPTK